MKLKFYYGKISKNPCTSYGSSNSMRGLDKAISIANASDAEITGYYVFHLPLAAGIKYTKKMKDDAQKNAVKAIGPAMQKCERAGLNSSMLLEEEIPHLRLSMRQKKVIMI